MKLRLFSSIILFALTSPAFASHLTIQSAPVIAPGKLYVGAFGGGGSSNNFDASQFGTAFFPEAAGGALSVNAFGQLNKQSTSFFGVQLGYQAPAIILDPCWTLGPAAELEAYTMNRRSFNGSLHNETPRLDEHDFAVSYPMRSAVFLANAVLSYNHSRLFVRPYIGFGIGNALVKISGANATQVNPPENVNHYNSSPSDTQSTFAGQIKLGLSYDINKYVNFFAEYRSLYLASTHFVFGSTVLPTHAPTSSWQVKLDHQRYNLGNIGVRFNW